MQKDIKNKLVKIYKSRKLQRLADLAGMRYQTIWNMIQRDGNMLTVTAEKINRAIAKFEAECEAEENRK